MSVRPAVEADVRALAELEAALFGADAWSEQQVRADVLGSRRSVLVQAQGLACEGYVVVSQAGDVADLDRIAVAADRRRQGLARSLLAAAVEEAKGAGAVRLLLEVAADNEGALAFYAAEGFAEIARRRRYYRSGADAVVMERALRT